MKRKNFIILLALVCILFGKLSPVAVFASEPYNIEARETVRQLVDDYNVPIYTYAPYISNTFVPQTNRIDIVFGSWGSFGANYTYYLEMRNARGTWIVTASMNTKGNVSTSENVVSGNTYRIRVTTDDKYPDGMNMDVSETI